ncbi:MAG: gliding motility-associated C-terminal domain-containing protein, partial [Bacteroidota bacterium]
VIITEPDAIVISQNNSTPANDANCDGSVDITVSGGVPGYTFQWSNGNTNEDPDDLCAGANSVTITDANGITTTITITVGNNSTLSVSTLNVDTNASCFGACDGVSTVQFSGGVGPFTFTWDDPNTQSTASATGLCAGTYSVIIQDNIGGNAFGSVTISEPTQILSGISALNISCTGENDGSAVVMPSGGNGPYAFNWSNGSTETLVTNLSPGSISITITDNSGCFIADNISISEPLPLAASVSSNGVACFGNVNGEALVNASGGTMPYFYQWDNGETTNPATSLIPGIHEVTISDSNGCLISRSVLITEPPLLELDGMPQATPATCFDGADGKGNVFVNGGTPPYSYLWDDPLAQTTALAEGLSAGNYTVSISDQNGCTIPPVSIIITQPNAPISLDFSLTNPTCWGASDGSIEITAAGGTPGYDYAWNNATVSSSNSGITSGNYTVTVTDSNECIHIETFTLTQPDPVSGILSAEDVICFGEANGQISVDTAFGGNGPYIYALDGENFQTDTAFGGLTSENYTVTIQDLNGCEGTTQIFVDQPFELEVNLGEDFEITLGDIVTLNPFANTFDSLSYIWEPSPFLSCLDCPNPEVFALDDVTLIVMIIDQNGCSASDDIFISVDKARHVFVPNAFSPNNDGVNDKFFINTNQSVSLIRTFRIMNRWGELIFEGNNLPSNDANFGWNGTFKGRLLNPGVFVYLAEIEFVDGVRIIYKGDVTLMK